MGPAGAPPTALSFSYQPGASSTSLLGAPPGGAPSGGAPPRVLLYVDRPTRPFVLQESDIRSCVSSYGPLDGVLVLRDRAAAEVSFVSASALCACLQELDGVPLEGVGLLRAVVLPPGVPAAAALPDSAADPPAQQHFAVAAGVTPGQQWGPTSGGPASHDPRQKPHSEAPAALQQQQQPAQLQHSNGRRVCRLELVGLFGEEPNFSVASAVRGPNDSNIQYILEQAEHKVDLGIRGKPINDAPVADRLHLTLMSDDAEAFAKALAMSEDLVQSVVDQFISYCRERHVALPPSVGFRRHMYQQQPDAGAPGGMGPLVYLGATERLKPGGTGGGPTPAAAQGLSPAAAAATAAAASAGGPLLPPLLPPGVLTPGPLPLAALAAAGLPGGPLGPLIPPGALGAAGVLGPPPFMGPPFHPPANGDFDQRHRERSRSRERGPPRDRDSMYRGGSPRRGAPGNRQPRRGGGGRGPPPGRGPRDEGPGAS